VRIAVEAFRNIGDTFTPHKPNRTLVRDSGPGDKYNRYLACKEAEVEPKYIEWDGVGNLVDYVVSLNLVRRQLNESQRGMVAEKLANMKQGERTDLSPIEERLSIRDAAKLLNVGHTTVERARVVVSKGIPELAQAVEKGEIKLTPAAEIAKLPQEEQRQILNGERRRLTNF
jgi:hypothetical protein